MKNNNSNNQNKVPNYPMARVPNYPMARVPNYPMARLGGNSSQFFEKFTKFKNTEKRWDTMGFTKKIE